jgi:hypothetical protein
MSINARHDGAGNVSVAARADTAARTRPVLRALQVGATLPPRQRASRQRSAGAQLALVLQSADPLIQWRGATPNLPPTSGLAKEDGGQYEPSDSRHPAAALHCNASERLSAPVIRCVAADVPWHAR